MADPRGTRVAGTAAADSGFAKSSGFLNIDARCYAHPSNSSHWQYRGLSITLMAQSFVN